MKALVRLFTATAVVASLGGCASTPADSGFLTDYTRLQQGQYLERYWADTSLTQRPTIRLDGVSVDRIADRNDVKASDSAAWLQAAVEEGGVASAAADVATARMELAITFMDPGSAAKRIWAGELGAGHAQVQVEGKVIDIESDEVLAAFAERRSSSGAAGLKDIGGDAGPALIEHMIREIGRDVSNELRHTFPSE